jgi:hypothetical protein
MWMARLFVISAAAVIALAAVAVEEPMQAVGAQKCGGSVRSFTVEFLAPESAALLAIARDKIVRELLRNGPELSLSIDGKACIGGQCQFRAEKGKTYTFIASGDLAMPQDLCISVVRP